MLVVDISYITNKPNKHWSRNRNLIEAPGEKNLLKASTSEIWILKFYHYIISYGVLHKYLVGILTGSSLMVFKPSFDPKYVKSFRRATTPTRYSTKRKAEGGSKLNRAE